MKIAVRDIVANPYRKIDNYPIDAAKVEALKESINQTGFWDNLVVREHPDNHGTYQLAYGHHRMEAVRQLGIETVDLPVREIADATMLRMMAQENGDIYKPHPRIVHETIIAAKEFIDGELAKYETWEEFRSAKNSIANLVESGQQFSALKTPKGAGRNIICAFLGSNWKRWMVEEALSTISRPEQYNREAVEKFDTVTSARVFKETVCAYRIPVEEQILIAEAVIEETGGSRRSINGAVKNYLTKNTKEIVAREFESEESDAELDRLQRLIKEATNTTKKFTSELWQIVRLMESIGMQEVHAVEGLGLRNEMVTLFHAIKRIQPVIALEEFTYGNEDGN